MMRAMFGRSVLALVACFVAIPAAAQVVHSVQVGVGGVFPRDFDARITDDVLRRNALGEALPGAPDLTDALAFRMQDFRTAQVLGEWNVSFGDRIELGAGVGFYRKTVPTLYYDLEDERGRDIEQEIGLRVVPITGIVRFMPFGHAGDVQPYVGAGVSVLNFRYSEQGEFVDGETLEIFDEIYNTTGTTVGGLLLGGVRLPMGGDIYSLGIEGRYQFGAGKTGGESNGFLADKIDLSGGQLNVTFHVRF